jgi:hypothetical protein
VSLFALSQDDLDCKCLSFFELTGVPAHAEGDDMSRGVGLTYNLETGILRWLKADAQRWGQLSLRDGRLAAWEPMTPEKMVLIAIDIGIASNFHVPVDYPGRFEAPEVSAVTVNPDGVVFYRDSDDKLSISDARRLTGGPRAVLEAGGTSAILDTGEWAHFLLSPKGKITAVGLQALEAGGRILAPNDPRNFGFTSLGNCSWQAGTLIGSYRPFSPEAAAYVVQRFGVDPHQIDRTGWISANKARLLSASFTNSTPFDPHAAIAALRIAVASEAAQCRPAPPSNAPGVAVRDVAHPDSRPRRRE